MSVFNLRLESVQRKTGGRIHLTPRVPRSGTVTTLCGQTLAAGSFVAVERDPDCTNCLRRSRDPSRISGAFFAQEEGSQLLQLSLEQARARRPAGKARPCPASQSSACCHLHPLFPIEWESWSPMASNQPARVCGAARRACW